jgi:hypothetical protein
VVDNNNDPVVQPSTWPDRRTILRDPGADRDPGRGVGSGERDPQWAEKDELFPELAADDLSALDRILRRGGECRPASGAHI